MHEVLPEAEVLQIDTQANVIQALESNRVDAAAVDLSTVWWMVKRAPDKYADSGKKWFSMLYSAALRQGDLDWLALRQHDLGRRHVRPQQRHLRQGVLGLFRPAAAGPRAGLPEDLTCGRRPSCVAVDAGGGRSAGPGIAGCAAMTYHINYNFVWQYFDKFYWGLLLGIELALISILIGAVFGLGLALVHVRRAALGAAAGRRLCRVHPQLPLLLLVYLVFYGIPSVGGFKYSATLSLRHRPCRSIRRPIWSRCSAPASMRCPRGLVDAGKAIGLTPWQRLLHVRLPTMLRITLPALSATVRLAVQGHVGRLRHRRSGTDLCARKWIWQPTRSASFEGYSILAPMYLVTGYAIFACFRLLERRFTSTALGHGTRASTHCRSCGRALLITLLVSAVVTVLSLSLGVLLGSLLLLRAAAGALGDPAALLRHDPRHPGPRPDLHRLLRPAAVDRLRDHSFLRGGCSRSRCSRRRR